MNISAFAFKPHSDMDVENQGIVLQHNRKIKEKKYGDAVAALDKNNYKSGFRASLFNGIQNKIRNFQIYLLNEFNAEPDELYSLTEPAPEQMRGKKFWIQPYDN